MTDAKFFHFGQFFSARALISTVIGVGLISITEFLLPWLGVLYIPALHAVITPATIVFTLAIIMVSSATAKNFAASMFLAAAAILSYYNPYQSYDFGFIAIVIIYLLTAFFSGLFATIEMSGRTALLLLGVIYGIQGLIGAGTSMYLSLGNVHTDFHDANIGIAFGEKMGSFPLYDVIVAVFSIIFMIVLIFISRKRVSTHVDGKKHEIIGQILIFLAIAGGITFIALSRVTFSQATADLIFGTNNTQFLNMLFSKFIPGQFTAVKLLNVFYILPIVGFVFGIALAIMIYKRAQGTTGLMRFNFEGPLLILNLAPILIYLFYSYPVVKAFVPTAGFYLTAPTVFAIFTEFTSLLLINLLAAYLLFKIISLIRNIIKK